jgi:hypothetical protein
MERLLVFVFIVFPASLNSHAASVFPIRPDDSRAVYLTPGCFAAAARGQAGSSAAIQSAIDKVEETTVEGIPFIPPGRYLIPKTIYVWSGIRLIGDGANRSVFLRALHPPGYQQGIASTFFCSGNPAAVCIRFRVAQHGGLAHMNFHIGSGLAALNDMGNEARLTLVHDEFRQTPTAAAIDPDHSDELWITNSRFENISGPAVLIGNGQSRMTEVNFEDFICRNVPVFARFRGSGCEFRAPSSTCDVKIFSHGLRPPSFGAPGGIQTSFTAPLFKPRSCPRQTLSGRSLPNPFGSTSARSAFAATASRTTPPPSSRPSIRIRSFTFPPAVLSSQLRFPSAPTAS